MAEAGLCIVAILSSCSNSNSNSKSNSNSTPIKIETHFGSDYMESSVISGIPGGMYELRVESCSGAREINVAVVAGGEVLYSTAVVCRASVKHRFELPRSDVEIYLDVEAPSSAEGTVRMVSISD